MFSLLAEKRIVVDLALLEWLTTRSTWYLHLFIWFFFCLVGVFPIRKDHNYDLWWPGGIDILWVHSLWHGQHNKAVLLWRVYLGICRALPRHYQSFLESSHHFESIWIMNSQVHYYSKYHFRKSLLRYGHLRQFPMYGVCKCRNLSGLFFPVYNLVFHEVHWCEVFFFKIRR